MNNDKIALYTNKQKVIILSQNRPIQISSLPCSCFVGRMAFTSALEQLLPKHYPIHKLPSSPNACVK